MRSLTTIHDRGRYDVVGWLILTSIHGEEGARQRVRELWTVGCRLRRVSVGYWLALPSAQSQRGPFPATPIVATSSGPSALTTQPPPSSAPGLHLPTPTGTAREVGVPERPADWLVLPFREVAVTTLAAPPAPDEATFEDRRVSRKDLGVAEPTAEDAEHIQRLTEGLQSGTIAQREDTQPSESVGRRAVRSLLKPVAAGVGAMQRTLDRLLPQPAEPRGPSWLDRLSKWLEPLIAPTLRKKHEDYLQSLADLFRDDLDLALRRAVPLFGDEASGERLAWTLSHRDNVLVPGQRPGVGSSYVAGSDAVQEQLRRQYQQAARQLEEDGHIGKAAYVLSDLLGDHAAAIRLCEKHEMYDIAARLAEMHGSAAQAVLLWLRHGDVPRAVELALRTQSFTTPLQHLDRVDNEAAAILRRAWADSLFRGGHPLKAIALMTKVPGADETVDAWIDATISTDGFPSLVARIHRLIRHNTRYDAHALLNWMQSASPLERALLLRECPRLADGSALAVQTYRALVRQSLPFVGDFGVPLAIDCLADIRQSTVTEPVPDMQDAAEHALPRGDATLEHVALLPNHLVLVTTGEDVRLYDLSGQELTRHVLRASHVVLPAEGGIVLLCERDTTHADRVHVYRLDTLSGDCLPWTQLHDVVPVEPYADTSHAGMWWVAHTDRVVALDVSAVPVRELVRITGVRPVTFIDVSYRRTRVRVQDASDDVFEYRAPDWRLRRRYRPEDFFEEYKPPVRQPLAEQNVHAIFDRDWTVRASEGQVRIHYKDRLRACFAVYQ